MKSKTPDAVCRGIGYPVPSPSPALEFMVRKIVVMPAVDGLQGVGVLGYTRRGHPIPGPSSQRRTRLGSSI